MRAIGGKGIVASSGWGGKAETMVKHSGKAVVAGAEAGWVGATDDEPQLINETTINP